MSEAVMMIGDVRKVLAQLPDQSVNAVITSPPYWRKRAYLPDDHPAKSDEIGQEASPGEFLAVLLDICDELWRIVRDDGTIWINLGDTASGSGGAGGDYAEQGWREGQNKYAGSGLAPQGSKRRGTGYPPPGGKNGIPRPKSICWIPEMFGASLAYGRNLLTGELCRQWITRPKVTWCKPAPTPGEILDKFREATELIVWASKCPSYYFDLDVVREPPKEDWGDRKIKTAAYKGHPQFRGDKQTRPDCAGNPKGVPPLDWWVINTSSYTEGHFATFPPELIYRPVIAACPPGGVILDPFGGSGTTGAVATGNDRNCVLIDFDDRNVDLAANRVGMFFSVHEPDGPLPDWLASPLPRERQMNDESQ